MRTADAVVTEALLEELLTPERVAALTDRLLARAKAHQTVPAEARVAAERQLTDVEAGLARLTAAVAAGGDVPALVEAIKAHERQRVALERRLQAAVGEWRDVLGRHVAQVRQIVVKLLVGRLTFEPETRNGRRGFRFHAVGTVAKLVSGVVPGNLSCLQAVAPQRDENSTFYCPRWKKSWRGSSALKHSEKLVDSGQRDPPWALALPALEVFADSVPLQSRDEVVPSRIQPVVTLGISVWIHQRAEGLRGPPNVGALAALVRVQRRGISQRVGETRRVQLPYIAHLLGVASLALEHRPDEDLAIAALLHDAVEDQGGAKTLRQIRRLYGDRVAKIVDGCSDTDVVPKPPWRRRKEVYLDHLRTASDDVRFVSACDKLHNLRAIVRDYRTYSDKLWKRFNGGKDGTLWYYAELAKTYRTAGRSPLVDEVSREVRTFQRLVRVSDGARRG